MRLEREFQRHLIQAIEDTFPGCIILKNNSGLRQGIPDIVILYGSLWAALEIKRDANARVQPNQEYYVDRMASMAYAAFVYPENMEDVLRDLQQAFSAFRQPRFSER